MPVCESITEALRRFSACQAVCYRLQFFPSEWNRRVRIGANATRQGDASLTPSPATVSFSVSPLSQPTPTSPSLVGHELSLERVLVVTADQVLQKASRKKETWRLILSWMPLRLPVRSLVGSGIEKTKHRARGLKGKRPQRDKEEKEKGTDLESQSITLIQGTRRTVIPQPHPRLLLLHPAQLRPCPMSLN